MTNKIVSFHDPVGEKKLGDISPPRKTFASVLCPPSGQYDHCLTRYRRGTNDRMKTASTSPHFATRRAVLRLLRTVARLPDGEREGGGRNLRREQPSERVREVKNIFFCKLKT